MSVGDARLSVVGVAGWPVTVGVVEVGMVDTRYGVSQPRTDAERYRCAYLHCTQGLAGCGDGYQRGLDWQRSSKQYNDTKRTLVMTCKLQ